MPNPAIPLAMAQMLVEGGKLDENLGRAVEMIGRAAAGGGRMVVLPECLDLGWTHPSARQLAEPIPGGTSDRLAQAAREGGVYVVAGLTERARERIFNAAVLIDPAGAILLKHRKINVLDIAQDLYTTGDHLSVAHTPLGTIGVNICADNFPDSLCLGHALARMGAQVLLSPSAWAVDADHDPVAEPYGGLWKGTYATLARLYEMPVVGVSSVGWVRSKHLDAVGAGAAGAEPFLKLDGLSNLQRVDGGPVKRRLIEEPVAAFPFDVPVPLVTIQLADCS